MTTSEDDVVGSVVGCTFVGFGCTIVILVLVIIVGALYKTAVWVWS